ncbi:hypothetical protein CCP2SC5_580011 [Azospirillaceae bacterium]
MEVKTAPAVTIIAVILTAVFFTLAMITAFLRDIRHKAIR